MRMRVVAVGVAGAVWAAAAWAGPAGESAQHVFVPAGRPGPVYTPQPLERGRCYLLTARGVYGVWQTHAAGVDAYYGYAEWRWGPEPVLLGGLLVNDVPMYEVARAWGDPTGYREDHVYTTRVRGRGRRLKLQTGDAYNGSWSDNDGGLEVEVRPCPFRSA